MDTTSAGGVGSPAAQTQRGSVGAEQAAHLGTAHACRATAAATIAAPPTRSPAPGPHRATTPTYIRPAPIATHTRHAAVATRRAHWVAGRIAYSLASAGSEAGARRALGVVAG